MKKLFYMLFLSLAVSSCYDDYIKDFDYTSISFPYQINVRTVVVGEGMKIEVGPNLGGVMENNIERQVNFTLDPSLVTPAMLTTMQTSPMNSIKDYVTGLTELKLMPADYFTVSSNVFTIKKGQHSATVVIRPDSVKFLSDPATLKAQYVLPFRITSADVDSILPAKNYAVIGLRYENMLFGNYYHGGVTTVKDAAGAVVSTVKYFTTIPQPDAKVWSLKTVAPNTLVTSGISEKAGSFKLTLNGGAITVSKADGSTVNVQPEGTSTFNQAKLLQNRKIILNYKYANADGTTSYAQDTLTFRNRIRDGVNEWLDENPNHYK
jgi:hypothetical protein